MGDVVPIRPAPPVHKMLWTWVERAHVVRGIEVWIVSSYEPPRPEFLVVLSGTYEGVNEVVRIDMAEMNSGATITQRVADIALALAVADATWFDDDEDDPGGGEADPRSGTQPMEACA